MSQEPPPPWNDQSAPPTPQQWNSRPRLTVRVGSASALRAARHRRGLRTRDQRRRGPRRHRVAARRDPVTVLRGRIAASLGYPGSADHWGGRLGESPRSVIHHRRRRPGHRADRHDLGEHRLVAAIVGAIPGPCRRTAPVAHRRVRTDRVLGNVGTEPLAQLTGLVFVLFYPLSVSPSPWAANTSAREPSARRVAPPSAAARARADRSSPATGTGPTGRSRATTSVDRVRSDGCYRQRGRPSSSGGRWASGR